MKGVDTVVYPLSFYAILHLVRQNFKGGVKMEIKTKEELSQFLMSLQTEISTLRETVDKLAPVEETPADPSEEETPAEPTAEEVSEIDQLLQED